MAGKFREIGEFPKKTPVRGIPGNSFWGPHFDDLGGGSGEMRMAKVDMLGRGETLIFNLSFKIFSGCFDFLGPHSNLCWQGAGQGKPFEDGRLAVVLEALGGHGAQRY